MAAGPKRHRLVFQALTLPPPNEYGERPEKEAWTDAFTVWGSLDRPRGTETFGGSTPQRVAQVDAVARIRFRTDINPGKNRIVAQGRAWDIVAVLPDNWNKETVIHCKAVDSGD